jgi:hypothetical protein
VLVSAVLLWIFESGSAVGPGRSGCLQVLQESFSSCLGGTGSVVSPKELKSASAKLLFFSQRWFALVLLSSYTALLAANLVVIQSRRGIETWEDVADKKIGVYGGGLSQVIASQHATDLKLIQAGKDYEHEIDAMLDVVNGKLDALAMHPIRAEYIIRHNERLCGLEVIAEPRGTLPCSMIFRPSLNPAVKRAIDSTITRLRAKDGSPLREMVKKYVAGGDAPLGILLKIFSTAPNSMRSVTCTGSSCCSTRCVLVWVFRCTFSKNTAREGASRLEGVRVRKSRRTRGLSNLPYWRGGTVMMTVPTRHPPAQLTQASRLGRLRLRGSPDLRWCGARVERG